MSRPSCVAQAILLVGMQEVDGKIVQNWVAQMDPEYRVWPVRRDQLERDVSLESILLNPPKAEESWPVYNPRTPPLVVFSGTTGLDMIAVIAHWKQYTGLEQPAFASTCKANMSKSLRKLIPEIIRSMNMARMSERNPDLIKLPEEERAADAAERAAGAAAGRVPDFMGGPGNKAEPIIVSTDDDLVRLREQLRSKFQNRDQQRHLLKKRMMEDASQERRQRHEAAVEGGETRSSSSSPPPPNGFGRS